MIPITAMIGTKDIEVGHHHKVTIGGLTFHADTILSTLVAGAIVCILGLLMARKATSGVPSKLQLFFETVTDAVRNEVEGSMGKTAPYVIPLAVTLFFFILFCNLIEMLPTKEYLPPATADVNLTYAMGILVILWVNFHAIKKKGLGYFKHFVQPYPVMLPINIVEELVKPFTLALRLFGNILSGGIMVALLGLLPAYIVPIPNAGWKLFDLAIGVIQAFIFTLLTIIYFGMASASHAEEHH